MLCLPRRTLQPVLPLLLVAVALAACDEPDNSETDDTTPDSETVPTDDSDPIVDTETDPVDTETDTETDTESDPPSPTSTLPWTGVGPLYCLAPSLRAEARFDHQVARMPDIDAPYVAGGGVGAFDIDGDDVFELFATREDEVMMFRRQADGTYDSITILEQDASGDRGWFGISGADYDGDLDIDLYVSNYGGPNVMLRNDGGRLIDVTDTTGTAGPPEHFSASTSWADFDRDGDLDLLISGHGHVVEDGTLQVSQFEPADPTLLFANNGDGTFSDHSHVLPAAAAGAYTFNATFVDVDADFWPEIYYANDFAGQREPSQCAHNNQGVFSLESADPSLTVRIVGMGLGVGDANGDAIPDILLPGWRSLGFLMSAGGAWFEQSQITGVAADASRGQGMAWGAELGDVDNDGDVDALVNFGYLNTIFATNDYYQPDAVYIQENNLQFEDRALEWDLNQRGSSRGLVLADLNRDGFLDVMKATLDNEVRVAESRCGDRPWLRVQLRQPGLNRHAVGARLEAFLPDGRRMTRWVFAGGTGYGSGAMPEVHFGLDSVLTLPELHIYWPDGGHDVLYDLPARHAIRVERDPT